MNVVWFILCYYLVIDSFLRWIFYDENFEGFSDFNNTWLGVHSTSKWVQSTSTRIVYNRETLLSIGEHVNKVKGNRLPPSVCVNIRKLRINKILKIKQRRKRGGRKKYVKQLACNASNLVKIKCLPQNGSMTNIHSFTANVRSLRNKEINVRNYILSNKIDFGVITETWYSDDADLGYVNDLNYDGLKLDAVNRLNGKKGGGIALVYRSYCNSVKIKSPKYSSFEHALWKLSCKGIHFTVLGIYHPPYSSINNITDNQFLDDFLDLLGNTMANYSNVVVLGDLNIHLNKTDEPIVQVFNQSLEMLGLQQIVTEFTHRMEISLT